MAEKRATPEDSEKMSDTPRPKKRAAPTIDLSATEVPQAAASGEPAPRETAGPPPSDPPRSPGQNDSSAGHFAKFNFPALAAGSAGAAVMTLLLIGLWFAGLLPSRDSGATVAPAGDTKSITALNDRIAALEAGIGKPSSGDAGAAERLAAVENAMKALGMTLTALNRRNDEIAGNVTLARERAEAAEKAAADLRVSVDTAKNISAAVPSAELDALQKRIAALEQTAKAATADRPARLALSALALRNAAASGAPFADALAHAKLLGADDKALAPLEPFAATGVPAPAALAQELRELLPTMLKALGAQTPAGGFLERLQANAGKLVRIRPVDAPPGDDTSAVLARIEIAAAHNDIGGALGDLAKLLDAARAPAQAWIAKATERQAALAAARTFALDTARALGQP